MTLVEGVLAELGAEFFFDGVALRPGRPTVFGRCQGKLVFGLPGNPVSTMVTFELFVLPAIDLLGGTNARDRCRSWERGWRRTYTKKRAWRTSCRRAWINRTASRRSRCCRGRVPETL